MARNHRIGLLASTLLLGACGGGGGGGPAFVPAPPPAPAPPPPPPPPPLAAEVIVIPEAKTSQDFTAHSPYGPVAAEGLQVSYDAVARQYHVNIPGDTTTTLLVPDRNTSPAPGQPFQQFKVGDAYIFMHATGEHSDPAKRYRYSNLASFSMPMGPDSFLVGATAFGMATNGTGMPRAGSAKYDGFLVGFSSERFDDGWGGVLNAWIDGTITLTFDFANASLSGSLAPRLLTYETYNLGTFAVSQPLWSVGSPSFSATLPGDYPGGARLTGTFTGPTAQELIGSFSFGYTSPIDGRGQSAGGAYLAKPGQ